MTDCVTTMPAVHIAIRDASDLTAARRAVRQMASREGIPEPMIEALATAVTEVARNILDHAGSGEMSLVALDDHGCKGVAARLSDQGPGIADIAAAMQDGFSTRGGLGSGLPGARRLVHDFEIESTPNTGTTVTLRQWARRPGHR